MLGRALTQRMRIEPRQYRIVNLDLGEGFPRRALGAFVVVAVCWLTLMVLIAGPPSRDTSSLYTLPPVFLTFFGYRENQRQPRRRNYVVWAVRIAYIVRGHRPVIRLGARRPYRNECMSWPNRLAGFWHAFDRTLTRKAGEHPEYRPTPTPGPAGPAITTTTAVRTYGFDHMQKIR